MSNDTSLSDTSIETCLTRMIKLVLFAVPLGPSLLSSLYIMICFIYQSNLRRHINHVMIAIIVIDFIELICDLVAISLPYLYMGRIYNLSVCLYWVTGNYALQGISAWLMAWASIDRYLFIFYHRFRSTFVRHDLPLVIICIFVVSWYVIVTLTHPCDENWFDGTKFLCGGPCFNKNTVTVATDWILIVLLPALLIVVINLLLLRSVLFQKCGRRPGFQRHPLTWRKIRKLLVQLLGIILVFLITQVPLVILSLIQLFFSPGFLSNISQIWLYYAPYLIYIGTPFAYIATTKDCQTRICRHRHRIQPIEVALLPRLIHPSIGLRNFITEEQPNNILRITLSQKAMLSTRSGSQTRPKLEP